MLFLNILSSRNAVMEQGFIALHGMIIGGARSGIQDSNLRTQDICTAYDSLPSQSPKRVLSRTAHRAVFALWVFVLARLAAVWHQWLQKDFNLLPPRREDECIDC
jgi:hypothetical protein